MAGRIVWKFLLDLIVFICVCSPLVYLYLCGKPYERGYFEDDQTIRLPFKEQSVTELTLTLSGFIFLIVAILIIEIDRERRGRNIGVKSVGGTSIPGWLWESYSAIGIFVFGAAMQHFTSDFTKYTIGRLRPHFYDVCKPIPISSPLNSYGYIQEYTCVITDEHRLKEMRLSFPSAHSSFAMYCSVFFIFYVQVKGKWRGSKLLRHGIQFATFIAAWYVGLTRVQEHYHHWSDVAAGFLIGAVFGFLVFFFVLKPKKYMPLTWEEEAPQNILPRPALAR